MKRPGFACLALICITHCFGLPISSVLNNGQGDFDPWNQTRWAAWYSSGKVKYPFEIDCSVRFAARTTPWQADLSSLTDPYYVAGVNSKWPKLFIVTTNNSIAIDGHGLVIDARKSSTYGWDLEYYYTNQPTTATGWGGWYGFYFHQTGLVSGTDAGSTLTNIHLIGFRHGISVDFAHQRQFTVSDSVFQTCVDGAYTRGANVTFSGCQFKENAYGGVYAECESHGYVFENCTFRDNDFLNNASYGDIMLDACYNYTIRNCQFLPAYMTIPYHKAITMYRNAGEADDIREHAVHSNLIENNTFDGYNVAIDSSIREGMLTANDKAYEGRCYTNNNTVRGCDFSNCKIGLRLAGQFNTIDNNTFTNVEREIVLHNVFYKQLGNTILRQPGTTVWLWSAASDYSEYADYVAYPTDPGLNSGIGKEEKLYFVRSDGTATINDPSPARLIVADTLLVPDAADYTRDLAVDMQDLYALCDLWLDGTADNDEFSQLSASWQRANDMRDVYSTGGTPIDIAAGDFALHLPGNETAVIWDQPLSNVSDTNYYSIIIYDANGVELDRCGRSTSRWSIIAAGNFAADTGTRVVNETEEIAAVSSEPDANGYYPIYIFRKGFMAPAVTLAATNTTPITALAAGNFKTTGDVYDEVAAVFSGGTSIHYYKPTDSAWTAVTTNAGQLKDIAAGNFDNNASNGDEAAGITNTTPFIYFYRCGQSGIYTTAGSAGQPVWSAIGAGNFDGGSTTRDEAAVAASVPAGDVYAICCYAAGEAAPFKQIRSAVVGVPVKALDGGNVSIGEGLGLYERAEGFSASDYGAAMAGWGDEVLVLPSAPQTTSIPVFWLNCAPDNSGQQYLKVTPVIR
jgi:parallel beta-helix repeat protein